MYTNPGLFPATHNSALNGRISWLTPISPGRGAEEVFFGCQPRKSEKSSSYVQVVLYCNIQVVLLLTIFFILKEWLMEQLHGHQNLWPHLKLSGPESEKYQDLQAFQIQIQVWKQWTVCCSAVMRKLENF